MGSKQARLVAAVADAMHAQGFSQSNLARMSGVSQSMISAALLGKYDLKEEKWRLLCEVLALDYKEIVSDLSALNENHSTPIPEERVLDDQKKTVQSCENQERAEEERSYAGGKVDLQDFLNLTADNQKVKLIFCGEYALSGTSVSISMLVAGDVLRCIVTSVEIEDDVLIVRVDESGDKNA